MAQLEIKQDAKGRETLERAWAAGLQEPVAQDARNRLAEKSRPGDWNCVVGAIAGRAEGIPTRWLSQRKPRSLIIEHVPVEFVDNLDSNCILLEMSNLR
jgi:hypothetical protein